MEKGGKKEKKEGRGREYKSGDVEERLGISGLVNKTAIDFTISKISHGSISPAARLFLLLVWGFTIPQHRDMPSHG